VPLQLLRSPAPAVPALLHRSQLAPEVAIMLSQLLGGAAASGIYLLIWLAYPKGMGFGDVELAAFVGLVTGYPGALVAVFASVVLGGFAALGLLVLGKAKRSSYIPYAPFLVVGALLMLLWGEPFLAWYALR
jgi:leader peptidase (prepilin peptidase) / N-methyltransferase